MLTAGGVADLFGAGEVGGAAFGVGVEDVPARSGGPSVGGQLRVGGEITVIPFSGRALPALQVPSCSTVTRRMTRPAAIGAAVESRVGRHRSCDRSELVVRRDRERTPHLVRTHATSLTTCPPPSIWRGQWPRNPGPPAARCAGCSEQRVDGSLAGTAYWRTIWSRSGGWFPGGDCVGDEVVHDPGVFNRAEMSCTVQGDQPGARDPLGGVRGVLVGDDPVGGADG